MRLFSRRPSHVPLGVPRLDGTTWPDEGLVGRPTFEANTFYELAVRRAYESEAHALAEELVAAVLPHLDTGADPEDEPYLRKVFSVAARVGVGLGMVERTLDPLPDSTDRRIAAALWQARRKLPAMQPHWARTAAYFVLAGHYVARTEPAVIPGLVEDLVFRPIPPE